MVNFLYCFSYLHSCKLLIFRYYLTTATSRQLRTLLYVLLSCKCHHNNDWQHGWLREDGKMDGCQDSAPKHVDTPKHVDNVFWADGKFSLLLFMFTFIHTTFFRYYLTTATSRQLRTTSLGPTQSQIPPRQRLTTWMITGRRTTDGWQDGAQNMLVIYCDDKPSPTSSRSH